MNEQIKEQQMALEKLRLPVLQAKFAEVTGETTRSPNKIFLIRRITEALHPAEAAVEAVTAKEPESDAPADKPETETPVNAAPAREKLTKLDVPTLQARYLEIVGRPSGSDKSYLIWKIKQAEQGKVPVGPLPGRRGDGAGRDYKILPVRMESDLVQKLDEAWQRQGLKNRMELFRKSLASYLASKGEDDLAELLVL